MSLLCRVLASVMRGPKTAREIGEDLKYDPLQGGHRTIIQDKLTVLHNWGIVYVKGFRAPRVKGNHSKVWEIQPLPFELKDAEFTGDYLE